MDKGDVTTALLMDIDDINNVHSYLITKIIPTQASVQQMWLHVFHVSPCYPSFTATPNYQVSCQPGWHVLPRAACPPS